ncbi:antiviral reverse transcriptase Drt3b [Nocardiopsis sp. NPDC057823]|uniref:antiviral reverse transcriptase Drt3b n=1 Tax=Nocardiopsis sp. NPDC057823 TaxID=3346256 RepID=UPI00366A6584
MSKKKINIRKKDSRVLLSEVLPYEVPPSFNNRGFYDFLNAKRVVCSESEIKAFGLSSLEVAYLSIILGKKIEVKKDDKKTNRINVVLPRGRSDFTVPFNFTIRHQSNKLVTLSMPHPRAQVEVMDFYSRYSNLMLYYTSRGSFSLRSPVRVARYSVVRDWLFDDRRKELDGAEEDRHEYEWLRSYFKYEKYSLLYRFYDSKEYRSYERKFGYLFKADVTKCFDSIYTHSVAWAVHGHEFVKTNIVKSKGSFGGGFDNLMQRMNHSETSGILIGPEFSRIFAELILQSVDVEVESELRKKNLLNDKDYKILRYVDDYFVFLASESNKQAILDVLARSLRKFKLHLNPNKEEGEYTPWLSPITVAKQRIPNLILEGVSRIGDENPNEGLPRPYIKANKIIVDYKSLLVGTGVKHSDVASFALTHTETLVEKLIGVAKESWGNYENFPIEEQIKSARSITGALMALVELAFFVYSGDPRMTPSVKVARIVSSVLKYCKSDGVPLHERERLEMGIREELVFQLDRSRGGHQSSVITATLLDCLSDLGPSYSLSEQELADSCGFSKEGSDFFPPVDMNAFMLFSMLLHMKNSGEYPGLREACMQWIDCLQSRPINDAERSIVNLNIVTCPFVDDDFKKIILGYYGYRGSGDPQELFGRGVYGNINWQRFSLYSALQEKRQHEVY